MTQIDYENSRTSPLGGICRLLSGFAGGCLIAAFVATSCLTVGLFETPFKQSGLSFPPLSRFMADEGKWLQSINFMPLIVLPLLGLALGPASKRDGRRSLARILILVAAWTGCALLLGITVYGLVMPMVELINNGQ